ncbi:MAG: gliding motility-associated C-terminal domain-containing protein [Saprospiraceae bacterium]|nr:gliding motility-associated C-terminal domain-containing protein [Saprospiraceae bacterium]
MKTLATFIVLFIWNFINAQSAFQIGVKGPDLSPLVLFNATPFSDTSIIVTGVLDKTSTVTVFDFKGEIIQTRSITNSNPFSVFVPTKNQNQFLISYDTLSSSSQAINRIDIIDRDFNIIKSIKLPLGFKESWSNYVHTTNDKGELFIVTRGNETWPDSYKYTLYKIDTLGNVLFAKEYKGNNNTFITSIVSNNDELFLVGQNGGKGFYHQIDNNGNTIQSKILNFIPEYINLDGDSNVILYGTTIDKNATVVFKSNKQLQSIWAKKITTNQKYFSFRGGTTTNKIITDTNNDIYIFDSNDTGESFEGLKVLKFDKNGNVLFQRLLLDNELGTIYSAFSFMGDFMVLAWGKDRSRLRKIKSDITAEDCASFDYCADVDDINIVSTDTPILASEGLPASDRAPQTLASINLTTFHSCKPLEMPNSLFFIAKNTYCKGDTIRIDTNQVYSLGYSEWTLANDFGSKTYFGKNPDFNPLDKGGKHQLIHKLNMLGCVFSDTIVFSVKSIDDIFLNKDTILCRGNELDIDLSTLLLDNIKWNDGSTEMIKKFSLEGKYSFTAKDTNGCKVSDSFFLAYTFLPDVDAGKELILCERQKLLLTIPIINGTKYLWNTGDITSEIEISEARNYIVTITNICGSKDFSFQVELDNDCSSSFFFPNIFSPNADGVNDFFQIIPKNVSITNFQIFDRWGNKVFSNQNDLIWDGQSKNQLVEQGVYILQIKYTKDQKALSYVSNITLLR